MAYGPKFKQELTVESFDNIELYNLMTGDVTHDEYDVRLTPLYLYSII